MTSAPFSTGSLSRYRDRLMGVAMLMVMLFHVGGGRHDTIAYCVSRCGNIGVDMFLFLSGIGLWFSWTRQCAGPPRPLARRVLAFYRRRYVRVYPAWLVIACLYYIPRYLDGKSGLAGTVLDIAVNWCFWERDELTFWFIPSIMMLYTVAPAYMELIRRCPVWRWSPVAAMLVCVLVQYWPPLHGSVGHLEIFFSRVPVFLLGINAGSWVRESRVIDPPAQWFLLLLFILGAVACVNFESGLRGRFPLFIERMVYIPLSVSAMLLLCRLSGALPPFAGKALAFIGSISLELYLVHAEFVLPGLRALHLGYWPTAVLLVAVSSLLAWPLHKAAGALTARWR